MFIFNCFICLAAAQNKIIMIYISVILLHTRMFPDSFVGRYVVQCDGLKKEERNRNIKMRPVILRERADETTLT